MTERRILGVAGLLMWLMVGVPVVIQWRLSAPWRLATWTGAFLLFGVLFLFSVRSRSRLLLALESLAVVTMTLVMCNGFEGTLLVLVAMQLGSRVSDREGVAWILIQSTLLAAAITIHWSARPAVLLAPPYVGFQILAFFTFASMTRLALANQELRGLQEILADGSRIAERLRISHELHDALGHRLTALTLNLEAALRRIEGPSRGNVETAQTLARELLADVRAIVAANRGGAADLGPALERLTTDLPRPQVHLQIATELRINDPERRHILLRAVQEIVTNAARHAEAENLWIVVERTGDDLQIRAHDDGRGASGEEGGFGLRGMRERIETAGGQLSFTSRPGLGFSLIATLPAGGP
jgi:signal transduction histidine kinase